MGRLKTLCTLISARHLTKYLMTCYLANYLAWWSGWIVGSKNDNQWLLITLKRCIKWEDARTSPVFPTLHIFINDLEEEAEGTFNDFADHKKLSFGQPKLWEAKMKFKTISVEWRDWIKVREWNLTVTRAKLLI